MLTALIVARDREARARVEDTLRLEWPDARIRCPASGRDAISEARTERPDLVVLDLVASEEEGLETLTAIRRRGSTAIVAIAPGGADDTCWERAIELGADEYVVAPLTPLELLARASVVLSARRVRDGDSDGAMNQETGSVSIVSDFRPNERATAIAQIDDRFARPDQPSRRGPGAPRRLTGAEYAFLARLARQPNLCVSVDALLMDLWGPTARGRTEFARVYARRIRERIEPEPDAPRHVVTERGIGYRFVVSESSPGDSSTISRSPSSIARKKGQV